VYKLITTGAQERESMTLEATVHVHVKLTETAVKLIDQQAKRKGLNRTKMIELLIREDAEQNGIVMEKGNENKLN
jgi:Ribbon-helix-helix protein, copG family